MTDVTIPETHAAHASAASTPRPQSPLRKASVTLALVSLLLLAAFPRALSERLDDFAPTATVRVLKAGLDRIAALTPLPDLTQRARDGFSTYLQSSANGR